MSRKVTIEFKVTFLIAVIIYFLVDFNFIFITQWDADKIANFLHTWLTLLTAYYLYNLLLKYAFKWWIMDQFRTWVWLLSAISTLILTYVTLTEILFYKLYYKVSSLKEETTFFEFDLPVTLVVLIFSSLYFYQKYYHAPVRGGATNTKGSQKKIKANKGKGQVFTSSDDIGLLHSEKGIVWLLTVNGEKYVTDYTLDGVLNELNSVQFFRLNRQTIIAKESIKGFAKLEYQKLEVDLIETMGNHKPLIVSKYNAPAFKQWLTNSA
jgi:hypothetical protein